MSLYMLSIHLRLRKFHRVGGWIRRESQVATLHVVRSDKIHAWSWWAFLNLRCTDLMDLVSDIRKKDLDGVYFWFTENSPVSWEQYLQGLRDDGYNEDEISYLSSVALRDACGEWAEQYSQSFKKHGKPEGQVPEDWCNEVMLENCLENPAILQRLLELVKAEFLATCKRKGL